MAILFKSFEAASRKPNMKAFGMFPVNSDLSWIQAAIETGASSNVATYASTVNFQWESGTMWSVTLTGDITTSRIRNAGSTTNFQNGNQIVLQFIQDATGGWSASLPSTLRVPSGYAISSVASTVTTLLLEWRSGGWDVLSAVVGAAS
jgi:hypothetical protein